MKIAASSSLVLLTVALPTCKGQPPTPGQFPTIPPPLNPPVTPPTATSSPTISSSPTTESQPPSFSSVPSISPTLSRAPSVSLAPSNSAAPSGVPTTSLAPTSGPTVSSAPSTSSAPTTDTTFNPTMTPKGTGSPSGAPSGDGKGSGKGGRPRCNSIDSGGKGSKGGKGSGSSSGRLLSKGGDDGGEVCQCFDDAGYDYLTTVPGIANPALAANAPACSAAAGFALYTFVEDVAPAPYACLSACEVDVALLEETCLMTMDVEECATAVLKMGLAVQIESDLFYCCYP